MEWMEVVDVIDGKTENFKNCVYLWRNKVNEKLYIGQAKDFRKRMKEHKWGSFNKNQKYDYNFPLHRAIRKYGIKNFEICILEKDLVDYEEMNERERYYIEKFDTLVNNKKGYNVASGGGNANVFAGKTEEEMREIRKKQSEAQSGEKAYWYGRTGADNPRSKAVIAINIKNPTITVEYVSMSQAKKDGFDTSNICNCCKGKLKLYKGYYWVYEEDYIKFLDELLRESLK